uniref:Alpha-(1,6)-fucosyltransferase n=2 Tax=Parascaris univalens TaxID=6257 RepID=A0A915BEH2_PARUN
MLLKRCCCGERSCCNSILRKHDVIVRMQQLGCSMRRAAMAAVTVWLLILIYLSIGIFTIQSREAAERRNEVLFVKYGKAMKEVGVLREQNEELMRLLKEKGVVAAKEAQLQQNKLPFALKAQSAVPSSIAENGTPRYLFTKEHEIARRDLDNSIRELFFYLNSQFEKNDGLPFARHAMNQVLSLLGQSAAFADIDGSEKWRKAALTTISAKIQSQLDRLQNPNDCTSARSLICQLNKGCGFGCQLHHVTYCFIVAYGTNRTLILLHDGLDWNYSEKGWTAAFLPISRCKHADVSKDEVKEKDWSSVAMSAPHRVVKLPFIDGMHGRPPFLPLAFPEFFASDLLKLHSNPPVFFISQFLRYLMRPNDELAKRISEAASKVPFSEGPVVGLQIRRTDKVGTEAAFHALSEYMKWTEYWFQVEEYRIGRPTRRRIYIATDDPSVFAEAKEKYSNYEVYGDVAIADSAQTKKRYSSDSLLGVIVDIEMLARCTYLVCTFSSQVCRMGYELMQIRVGDAGSRFHSLDDVYYYGGQQAHEQVVVEAYEAESKQEISLKVGDVVGVAGNHWDGFSKGTNRRTGANGLYPSYKVREKWIVV